MHKPLTLLQRLAARAEASDCDCQTDDADLLNEAIAALAAKDAEIVTLREALEHIADIDTRPYRCGNIARAALKGDAA